MDSGKIPELGTGHLYRCINIYRYLIKKKIDKKKILFITKTKGKYSNSEKILKKFKINYKSIGQSVLDFSKQEQIFLNKFKSKVIIFDRLSKITNSFLFKINDNYKKVVGIDILANKATKLDLLINPLNNKQPFKKKIKNFKNNILPSINEKKIYKNKKKNKKIFTFFGGYDYKNIKKIILKLKINNSNFFFPENKKKFYELMGQSDIVLCSGGLTVFDAIYFNKVIIAIPQYNHQLSNLKCLKKAGVCYLINNKKNFQTKLELCLRHISSLTEKQKKKIHDKQKKIIYYKSQIKLLKKIYEFEKSAF